MADSPLSESLLVAQYEALRTEIGQRIDLRQQVLTFTMIVAASFFGLGLQSWAVSLTILCYPLLALFLACAWVQHNTRIGQITGYLQRLETMHLGSYGPGWETYRHERYAREKRHHVAVSLVFPARGIFLCSQLLAMVVGIARFMQEPTGMLALFLLLVVVDGGVILWTYGLLRHRRERPAGVAGQTEEAKP